jgi:hypothetical protein
MSYLKSLEQFKKDITNLKSIKNETKDHIFTLVDDLLFRFNSIEYHFVQVNRIKNELEKQAKEKALQNIDHLKKNPLVKKENVETLIRNVLKENKSAKNVSEPLFEVTLSSEIDSDKLFFEFESLLFSLSSFVDYSIRITKVLYPKISTRKSRLIDSLEKSYPDSKVKVFFHNAFKEWINELLKYRDYMMHLSSLNSHIVAKAFFKSSSKQVRRSEGTISVKITGAELNPIVEPIYLPFNPDYKYKIMEQIENKDLNYDEDFYTFEDYCKKLKSHFKKYSYDLIRILRTKEWQS